MIDRTAVSRAIRNIMDGPRPLAGRTTRRLVLQDGRDVLPAAPDGCHLPPAGTRLDLPDPSPHAGASLWVGRVAGATHLPRLGAVIDAAGSVHRATANEAAQYDPDFTSFPYLRTRDGVLLFNPPDRTPEFGPTTVWLPFHATYNYGHFVLDALPSLLAAEELGALGAMPPIAPPLKRWQEELLALAFPNLNLVRTNAHVVRLQEALYASSMDNFLHAPTDIVRRVRDRVLSGAPRGSASGPRRIYLSRRGWSMRVMLNEEALEAALRARDFTVVHPEELPVVEQINLMRDAEVVVAPTGAGLANALFAPSEARVIEIKPLDFGGPWVGAFRAVVRGGFLPFVIPEVTSARETPIRHRLRLGFRFAYTVPLEPFLAEVDARL